VATGSIMGIRESRRIMGEEKMTVDHYLARANFPNEIGRYAYPIDAHAARPTQEAYENFHRDHTGPAYKYQNGENYGIPYGILLPKGIDNVLVAGRCVSTDRKMQSSIRVMPGCYIMGQAAGAAAAMAAAKASGPKDVSIAKLQANLAALGAYVPNRA